MQKLLFLFVLLFLNVSLLESTTDTKIIIIKDAVEVNSTVTYIPPVIPGATRYNRDYYEYCIENNIATQETPWGFQEIILDNPVTHNVRSIQEYKSLINNNTSNKKWKDNKTHIINFAAGIYNIPADNNYYILYVPTRTIVQGAGIGNTVFKAVDNVNNSGGTSLFSIEKAKDIVLRGFSFYNETADHKWKMLYAANHNSNDVGENFLVENVEFDDTFGAFGSKKAPVNFITLRGLRKRIGSTTQRILDNYETPIPSNYQFARQNNDNIELAGQIGIRDGNSVVIHDCILGDNISATIDTYSNYIEIVGTSFIDPLHDHSIKMPHGNHLYIHDSSFELRYTKKIIDSGTYWNPTFFTHEGFKAGDGYPNYHFKNLSFTRAGEITNFKYDANHGTVYLESEPFMLYNNRVANVSGDMVWENIEFYNYEHKIVGFANVQLKKGFKAINYTNHTARVASMKAFYQTPDFTLEIEQRTGNARDDLTGVYSWGQKTDKTIDYPRDNRAFGGNKSDLESQAYVQMLYATVKDYYNALLDN